MSSDLNGIRVLIVEDSPVVADASEDILTDLGCDVVGPATNMAAAWQLAENEDISAALVDINIRGGKSWPVLRILDRRRIPFILTSGYADWSMPEEWQDRPRVPKPYTPAMLQRGLSELVSTHSGSENAT